MLASAFYIPLLILIFLCGGSSCWHPKIILRIPAAPLVWFMLHNHLTDVGIMVIFFHIVHVHDMWNIFNYYHTAAPCLALLQYYLQHDNGSP